MIAPIKPESWQLKDPRDYPQPDETCGAAAAAWACVGVAVLVAVVIVVEVLNR
jgi:hypothetical protein